MISSLMIESIVMLVFFISGILLFKYVDTEDFNSLAFLLLFVLGITSVTIFKKMIEIFKMLC